jgi:hypothetical protein
MIKNEMKTQAGATEYILKKGDSLYLGYLQKHVILSFE